MTHRILLVDDDKALCEMTHHSLVRRGMHVVSRASAEEAWHAIAQDAFDVVVTDLNMSGMNGIELCKQIVASQPDLPVVLMTAFGSIESAVAAIRAGAYDFVTKPFQTEELALTIERAAQLRALREEVKRLRLSAGTRGFDEMIGDSPPMREMYELLERIADTETTVLVTGESGTGKELVARALHRRGRRSGGPFVAINCAAVPESLLESELFGHARGAFTDARVARPGLFVQASGGTLFLDEIGEMSLPMQVKLLRTLQERTVRPVGGNAEVPFDARIVTATNRDLEAEIANHRFREDLYYRINVVRVHVPPLRTRGNDVLSLAQHFVAEHARRNHKEGLVLASAVAERFLEYDWPGNVRELQNCLERAVALTRSSEIEIDCLPDKVRRRPQPAFTLARPEPDELLPMEEIERRYVLKVLDAVGGNKTLAAQVLGFDRRTLYRKLERYGVAVDGGTASPD